MKRLITANKAVGAKQTTKATQSGNASVVYIAKDADPRITEPIKVLAEKNNVEVVNVNTMVSLGEACGVGVKTATAAIFKA